MTSRRSLAAELRHGSAFVMASIVLVAAIARGVWAHHSTFGVYDAKRIVEIEGVITSVRWRNPHPSYTVAVVDEQGRTVEWQVETGAISALRLRGLDREVMKVGDRVRLAGEGSPRGRSELFARNLLREDGQEVLLSASSRPRWSEGNPERLFKAPIDEGIAEQARREARGIFRVWTSVLGDPKSFPLYGAQEYPLTERGKQLKAAWDPRASPYARCGEKGMPYVMVTPYPLAFVQEGENIVIRFEEFDVRRLIHMNAGAPPTAESFSLQGFSTGRWEGNTLVVETTRIDSPHFYGDGTPQSRAMRTVERFTLDAEGTRLGYHLRVEDPEIFTEPMEFTRYWAWRPEIALQPFGCDE
jgi:hypothetical protein